MVNIQVKPYTSWMMAKRADGLATKYPAYNEGIVKDFSETDMFGSSDGEWHRERSN